MKFNQVFFYILAWSVYGLQGGFLPMGIFFAKIICLIFLLISFYHFVFVNMTLEKLPKYFWGLNTLIGLFFIYGFLALLGITTNPLPEEYLKNILISLLPIYSFFFFTKKGLLSEKNICFFISILFIFAIINFYGRMYSNALLLGNNEIRMTNNSGYLFLPLIAASVFFSKQKIMQYILVSICLFFSIQSIKRGTMFICFVCLAWFLLNDLRGKQIKVKIGIISLFTIITLFGYEIYDKYMSENYIFQKKMEELQEGGGSGRDALYNTFSNYFLDEATPIQFLFGSGANATLDISTNYAHNDWLEIAVNQGVFGLLIYILYWVLFGKECFSTKYNSKIKLALQIVFVDYFMRTLFSMSYGAMSTSATFILGYCLAQENENEKNYKIL